MKRKLEIFGALMGWFAVVVQFILMMQNRQTGYLEAIVRFFSFFTILTNILVALYFTTHAFRLAQRPFRLFYTDGARSALTTFILIVGLVYQIALRHIWEPTGMQFVVDELLHTIIPVYVLGYWCMVIEENDLRLPAVFQWLIYPAVYILWVMGRGSLSGFYPYPFLNVDEIGLPQTLLNIGAIFLFSIILMIVLRFLGRWILRWRQN